MHAVSYAQVRTMLRFAESHGLCVHTLRSAVGLPKAGTEDPDQRIPAPTVRALWKTIAAKVPDSAFALHIARHAEPAAFGLVGALLQSSRTLGDALGVLARHQRLLADDGLWDIRSGARDLQVSFVVPAAVLAEIGIAPIEMSLGAVLYGARTLTGMKLLPRQATFTFPRPSHAHEYTDVFGRKLIFGAESNRLTFERAVGDLPITTSAPQLARLLEASVQDRLAALTSGKEWTTGVTEALQVVALRGDFGAAAVASHLRCSPRTLARRLKEEGTSLRELTDSVRLTTARTLMGRRDVSLEEIASLLGFSEFRAFHRAFVRWTGCSPGKFRKAYPQG
jgi:AraC-like DNA-binding protein